MTLKFHSVFELTLAVLLSGISAADAVGSCDESVSLVQSWLSTLPEPAANDTSASKRRPSWNTHRQPKDFVLFGVETRDNRSSIPLLGSNWNIANLGAGKNWTRWLGRLHMHLAAVDELAAMDEEQMVIFSDVEDMVYGGCSSNELLNYYQDTVDHSNGASVVFGAAIYCFPCPDYLPPVYEKLMPRRKAVLDAANLSEEIYTQDPKCPALLEMWNSSGYVYLNAGFVMGPAGKVRETLHGMLKINDEMRKPKPHWPDEYDDQWAAAVYMSRNPDKVTLDYTGRLVLTDEFKMMRCHRNVPWVHVEGQSLVNTVTKSKACFVHTLNSLPLFEKKGIFETMRHW